MSDPAPAVHFVPYAEDPVQYAAAALLQAHRHRLPDLSRTVVLLPPGSAGAPLRRALLAQARLLGHDALLGPLVVDLGRWVAHETAPPAPIAGDYGRELMLVEALQEHPRLFGATSTWSIAAGLITLFDELTLHRVPIPESAAEFTARLQSAYGVTQPASRPLAREAELVHTLWRAWHAQLEAEGTMDGCQAYVERLLTVAREGAPGMDLMWVGPWSFLPAEWALVTALAATGRAALVLHGAAGAHPLCAPEAPLAGTAPTGGDTTTYADFLDAAFVHTEREIYGKTGAGSPAVLAERALAFRRRDAASPAASRLFSYEAHGAEAEARAVDVQVRRWLLEGRRRIGIVTADRRLARRVRALLERAGVSLHDAAGWALSTTSAAAALERWLQTVESDFHHQPLVDLLRSPFVFVDWGRERLQTALYRLEQDIIVHENIARGMGRYRHALKSRQRRLGVADLPDVHLLLDMLVKAAAPFAPFVGGGRHAPARLLEALGESMARLGMDRGYAADPAGTRILDVLEELRRGLTRRRIAMTWVEFRSWIGRALEYGHFRAAATAASVELSAFDQSALARYDALVLAGLDRRHLPGDDGGGPFFNQAVRAELGLPSAAHRKRAAYHHFRRLLEAAPVVLLTASVEADGEPLIPSPWLTQLQAFHRLAYGVPLPDNGLGELLHGDLSVVVRGDGAPRPQPQPRPAPPVDPALIPHTVTATAHQQLVDCPYQFFAARCLGLSAPEPVSEKLQKSDYGERVHLILQAFHGGARGLPGPFTEALNEGNRDTAAALLRDISTAVFARDLEDNFQHRGWLRRWQALIDRYLDWQLKHAAAGWRVHEVEARCVTDAAGALIRIKGRLDRIDTGPDGAGIIDYKTGAVPTNRQVRAGEAVQLPFYALLCGRPVARVEYLKLDGSGFGGGACIAGEELARLTELTARRLSEVMTHMMSGAALPAWGDDETCGRCRFDGVCRRQAWLT